jgi:hypothetical protein
MNFRCALWAIALAVSALACEPSPHRPARGADGSVVRTYPSEHVRAAHPELLWLPLVGLAATVTLGLLRLRLSSSERPLRGLIESGRRRMARPGHSHRTGRGRARSAHHPRARQAPAAAQVTPGSSVSERTP